MGRVGGHRQFQFEEFSNETAAHSSLAKLLESKTIKRGNFVDLPGIGRVLRPKDEKKGCYLVRVQTARDCYLTSAKNICNAEIVAVKPIQNLSKPKYDFHPEVVKLLSDLSIGVTEYTRSSIVNGNIPSLDSISQARKILQEACKHLSDEKSLKDLTEVLYSKIPKIKNKNDNWLLGNENIKSWSDDLDAFESCVNSSVQSNVKEFSYSGDCHLEYLDNKSKEYQEIVEWIKTATRNKHSYIRDMRIKHIFQITNNEQLNKFEQYESKIVSNFNEKPLHQPINKILPTKYNKSNTNILFHGTRSCNAVGLLKSGRLFLPKSLNGVSINGALYGGGIYHADDWKKSAGYCSIDNSAWARGSGKISKRAAFMFINYVTLGNIHVEYKPKSFIQPPNNFHSVMGKAGTNVLNNEFVTYDESSIFLKYLIEFEV